MKIVWTLLLAALFAPFAIARDTNHAAELADIFGQAVGKARIDKSDEILNDSATVYWIHAKFHSKVAFDKYLKGQFQSFDLHTLSFNPDDGVENETISTTWGTFAFNYGRSDAPVSNRFLGRYTAVAVKINDKWQLVSIHLSLPYPPDLPPAIN